MNKKSVTVNFGRQLSKVYRLMRDGKPRTLYEISVAVGASEASVSARLRDLRKAEFGSFTVSRKKAFVFENSRLKGVFKYAVSLTKKRKRRASRT